MENVQPLELVGPWREGLSEKMLVVVMQESQGLWKEDLLVMLKVWSALEEHWIAEVGLSDPLGQGVTNPVEQIVCDHFEVMERVTMTTAASTVQGARIISEINAWAERPA